MDNQTLAFIGILVFCVYLLIQLAITQKKLNFSELRYSEIKKSDKDEKLHNLTNTQLSEQNYYQSQLIKLLIAYIINKPVLLLFDTEKSIPKVKRSFEIKRNGVGSCRVKSNKEGGRRVTRMGVLALENPQDHSYIMIEDIEKASKLVDIKSFGEAILKRTIYEVIDTSEDN